MSYENAPQTKMLATNCIVCGKELCDAASVEAGMGPTCRKNTGYADDCSDDNRIAANKHIHTVAVSKDTDERIKSLESLLELGFSGTVKAILKVVADIKIAMTDNLHAHGGDRIAVKTPYHPRVVVAMREIEGRRWDKEGKVNTFPASSKVALFRMLCEEFEGAISVGPKGIFKMVVPQKKEENGQAAAQANPQQTNLKTISHQTALFA